MKTLVTRRQAVAAASALAVSSFADGAGGQERVGMQLILAADVSGSVNASRYKTQQEGYLEALGDSRVLGVIESSTRQCLPSPSSHGRANRKRWCRGCGSRMRGQWTCSAIV